MINIFIEQLKKQKCQWILMNVILIILYFFLLPKYVWSFDGARYIYEIHNHLYVGITGHPVYAYIGWLFNTIFNGWLHFSAFLVADIYTFFTTLAIFNISLLFTRELAKYCSLKFNLLITAFLILATPYYLYYIAQVQVYPLSACFALLTIYFLILPFKNRYEDYRNLSLATISYGLGVGTHINLIFILPIILFLIIKSERWNKISTFIIGILLFSTTIFLIYWPAYQQFGNLSGLINWATAHGASGHFFGASAKTLLKKMILVLLLSGPGLFITLFSTKIIHKKQKYLIMVSLFCVFAMMLLYASSPVNGEIEQLFFAPLFLAITGSILFSALGNKLKAISITIAILMFLIIIPLKVAFNLKDSIISGVVTLAKQNVNPKAEIINAYNTYYLKLLLPNPVPDNDIFYSLSTSTVAHVYPTYFLDSDDLLPRLDEKHIPYHIVAKWQRSKLFFEPYLSKFINLPYSWRGSYVLAELK